MTSLSCKICLDDHPVPDFRFFPCGHGFCMLCVDAIFKRGRRHTCPHCRQVVFRENARAVFLEIVQPPASAAEAVIRGLDQMNKDSKLISIQNAEKNMRKAARTLECSDDLAAKLIQAIEDYKDRVLPVFTTAAEQAKKITSLQDELATSHREKDDLEANLRRVAPAERELDKTRKRLHGIESEYAKALELAEIASAETVNLRRNLEDSEVSRVDLEEKALRYKRQLHGHTRVADQQAKKIKKLEDDIVKLTAQIEAKDIEESLVIRHDTEAQIKQDYDVYPGSPYHSLSSSAPPPSWRKREPLRDVEAPPLSEFLSYWQKPSRDSDGDFQKKRKRTSENQRTDFPIKLDRQGRPIGTVQLGLRNSLKVHDPLKR